MTEKKKTAVVLMNLGGPDSREAIRPFLLNFFMDPNIIRAPFFVRWCVARLIAYRRSKKEAGASYAELGGKSPLLDNTKRQAEALQQRLGDGYKVFITMRYWHPLASDVVRVVAEYVPDRVVLLPLYPQYSTTTTKSSFEAWKNAAREHGLDVPTHLVGCYPTHSGFVAASADLIRQSYETALAECVRLGCSLPRVLFSAHGLPEKIVADGDPYQFQCEETARAIVQHMGIDALDWQMCYQSRVGPMAWIGPSTSAALQKAGDEKVPVVIYPLAFVSEHVETLVEIEQEYRREAAHFGVPLFYRVSTVAEQPKFIEGLCDLVHNSEQRVGLLTGEPFSGCPAHFTQCGCRKFAAARV